MKEINSKEVNEGYYLSFRLQTNELYSVHKSGCPFMPDNPGRVYLGKFSSWKCARAEGRKIFSRATECPFCTKVNRKKKKKHLYKGYTSVFPTIEQISRFEKQTVFFILN